MSPLRTVVCDDEPLAVRRLASMLGSLPDIEVVGTAPDGREALALLTTLKPDLILLDIEMPEMDGFDVVEELTKQSDADGPPPLVAFVTAYRRFASQAFDSGAVDFLTKPVRLRRLETTIERARLAIGSREAAQRLIELQRMLDTLRGTHDPYRDAHVWVPRRGEMVRIDLGTVEWIAAEGAYVRLHLGVASYLLREAIGAIEQKLDPSRFARVHRSFVVRMDHVATMRRTHHGAAELVLRSGEIVPLGRKYARETRRRLFGDAAAMPTGEESP